MTTKQAGKLFAFKLAEQKNRDTNPAPQWQVRDGVAVAACTDSTGGFDLRYSNAGGTDNGVWC